MIALALALLPLAPQDCGKAVSRLDLMTCAQDAFDRAEAAMTAQWRTALKAVASRDKDISYPAVPMRDGLLESQRAWIAFRESQCSLESSQDFGGWGQDLDDLTCRARMAAERTKALHQFAEGL